MLSPLSFMCSFMTPPKEQTKKWWFKGLGSSSVCGLEVLCGANLTQYPPILEPRDPSLHLSPLTWSGQANMVHHQPHFTSQSHVPSPWCPHSRQKLALLNSESWNACQRSYKDLFVSYSSRCGLINGNKNNVSKMVYSICACCILVVFPPLLLLSIEPVWFGSCDTRFDSVYVNLLPELYSLHLYWMLSNAFLCATWLKKFVTAYTFFSIQRL